MALGQHFLPYLEVYLDDWLYFLFLGVLLDWKDEKRPLMNTHELLLLMTSAQNQVTPSVIELDEKNFLQKPQPLLVAFPKRDVGVPAKGLPLGFVEIQLLNEKGADLEDESVEGLLAEGFFRNLRRFASDDSFYFVLVVVHLFVLRWNRVGLSRVVAFVLLGIAFQSTRKRRR